ncbi:hypothetical protein N0V94_006460 [Neodidymelliopsis sp. IMI 364377]|nr:hypothetical protein N0V94_006460 [Neodidymelliopsis sp. IMI 364377]
MFFINIRRSTLLIALYSLARQTSAQVDLGSAASFGVIASAAITNTGDTVITGNLGIFPNTGSSITGFPPGQVTGTISAANGVADQALQDAQTAYNTAANLATTSQLASAELGGQVLVAGVYTSGSAVQITGLLVLDGQNNPNSLFVFQIGSTLTTASAASVVLANGAQACNVFFQVGSSATLGTSTNFNGNILALTSISLNNGVSVNGGLYAINGAVTLINDSITAQRACVGEIPISTTEIITSTTVPNLPIITTESDIITTVPVDDITTVVTGEPPCEDILTTITGGDVTVTVPGDAITSIRPGEVITVTIPGGVETITDSDITVTIPGNDITKTIPGGNVITTIPGSIVTTTDGGVTITVPGEDMTMTVPGEDITVTIPGSNIITTVPGSNIVTTVPGSVIVTTQPGTPVVITLSTPTSRTTRPSVPNVPKSSTRPIIPSVSDKIDDQVNQIKDNVSIYVNICAPVQETQL